MKTRVVLLLIAVALATFSFTFVTVEKTSQKLNNVIEPSANNSQVGGLISDTVEK